MFCWKFFIVAKSFPRREVWTKNFHQQFFGPKLCMVAKWFTRNRFEQNIFIKNLQNRFLENRFEQKIFINNFLVQNFLWLQNRLLETGLNKKFSSKICKIVSSKTGLSKIFSSTIFWPKFFYGCKIVYSKTGENQKFLFKTFYGCKTISSRRGFNQKFSSKYFGRKFLWLQNHFYENRFLPKMFIKNLW